MLTIIYRVPLREALSVEKTPFDSLAGVYGIRRISDGALYVGSSIRLRDRVKQHRCILGKNKHHARHLQHSFNRDGIEAFEFEILEICRPDVETLFEREQAFYDQLSPKFNTRKIVRTRAPASTSEETRKRISEAQKGKKRGPCSPERNARLAESQRGHVVSQAARDKISAALTGRKLGPQSAEWREKISAAQRGQPRLYARGPRSKARKDALEAGAQAPWGGSENRKAFFERIGALASTPEARAKLSATLKGKPVWWQTRGLPNPSTTRRLQREAEAQIASC